MDFIQVLTVVLLWNIIGLGKASTAAIYKCPYDWKLFEDTCYLLDGSLLNWNDANAFCQKQNASLVSITSQSENEYIQQMAQDKSYDYIWIGLNFQNFSRNWYWTTEEILLYTKWQGTPDIASGECAYFNTSNGLWSNMLCQSNNTVMCQKGVQKFGCLDETWYGNKDECYKYFNNCTTHDEATQSCRSFRNADLASIHSLDEDEFVQTIIGNFCNETWLGLNYSKEFDLQWTDETDVEYSINGINQTDIDGKCAAYSQDDDIFSWKFMDCSTENAYVCKDMRGNKHITNLAF
ncbi:lymphocyte antigen 75-like [Antedon mediterranea]|uniref:lymphocyte antigen 75-like n=1 Tax=Antedon mediterranea TaxID=105859 RepID=UPI003AF604EA